jgi:hypothetical protein
MGFEEQFPGTAKVIRLVGATLVPGFLCLFSAGFLVGSVPISADPGDLQRFALDRAFFVAVVALFGLGMGAFCGEVAYPHSARVPAFLGALPPAVLGAMSLLEDMEGPGSLQLGGFLLLFVTPWAYVLGALWRQKWRRRKEGRVPA